MRASAAEAVYRSAVAQVLPEESLGTEVGSMLDDRIRLANESRTSPSRADAPVPILSCSYAKRFVERNLHEELPVTRQVQSPNETRGSLRFDCDPLARPQPRRRRRR